MSDEYLECIDRGNEIPAGDPRVKFKHRVVSKAIALPTKHGNGLCPMFLDHHPQACKWEILLIAMLASRGTLASRAALSKPTSKHGGQGIETVVVLLMDASVAIGFDKDGTPL